ncbi:hypothetical protein GCM10023332_11510 [Luteimonas vadosa]|uniref:Uncharacterized protein n=1 Tax=Luteimonas vadosa TaxID=1165507 RepID=A0ABP9DXN2_9GAMM
MQFPRIVTFFVLFICCAPSLACSWPSYTPQEKYRTHSTVVLAYPIAVHTTPSNALSSSFSGAFKQTIQWRVLVSWKGKYQPGDVLLTRISYQTTVCGDGAQRKREVKLLYLRGKEPYQDMIDARPDDRIDDMKYLSKRPRGG